MHEVPPPNPSTSYAFNRSGYTIIVDTIAWPKVFEKEQETGHSWYVIERDKIVLIMLNDNKTPLPLSRFILEYSGPDVVDHVNRNTFDNRFCNLRVVSRKVNRINSKVNINSQSGIKGISLDPNTGLWRAHVRRNGKGKWLGSFPTQEEACAARLQHIEFLDGNLLGA